MRRTRYTINVDKNNVTNYDPNIQKIVDELCFLFEQNRVMMSCEMEDEQRKELAYCVDFCLDGVHSPEINTAFNWLFFNVYKLESTYLKKKDYVKIVKKFISTIFGISNTNGKPVKCFCSEHNLSKTIYVKDHNDLGKPEIKYGVVWATMYYELAKLNYNFVDKTIQISA